MKIKNVEKVDKFLGKMEIFFWKRLPKQKNGDPIPLWMRIEYYEDVEVINLRNGIVCIPFLWIINILLLILGVKGWGVFFFTASTLLLTVCFGQIVWNITCYKLSEFIHEIRVLFFCEE